MGYPKAFDDLVQCFKRLPGVGAKSAQRMAYQILNTDEKFVHEFATSLINFKKNIKYCQSCGHLCDDQYCEICQNPNRDQSVICIVEKPQDVYAMENLDAYKGLYHVIHGTMSILEGRSLDDLNVATLFNRINDQVKEIIIATNPTREGETTALYLAKLLEKYQIKVSRIAHGLPIGSNIDYADEMTLLKSLEGRNIL